MLKKYKQLAFNYIGLEIYICNHLGTFPLQSEITASFGMI
jgi:hypothetical protein